MFRCKDLLLLPSMAKARPLAGKEGMNNLIRWVYKPEDMNFSKWVHGNELLIVSLPVIKNPHFNLYRLLEKAISLHMSGMGISSISDRVESLHNSYEEASQCIQLMELLNYKAGLLFYEDTELYRLFLSLPGNQPAADFVKHTLDPILEYDKENHTDLLQTLKSYLWNNNSLLHTSEELHMHRNTVNYRIKRIEELTGRSVEDADTKLAFMNAILCKLLLPSA